MIDARESGRYVPFLAGTPMSDKLQPFIDQCTDSGLLSTEEVMQVLLSFLAERPLDLGPGRRRLK